MVVFYRVALDVCNRNRIGRSYYTRTKIDSVLMIITMFKALLPIVKANYRSEYYMYGKMVD